MQVKQIPDGAQRNKLLEMARTWDALAEDRDRLAQNYPEVKAPDGNKDPERTASTWPTSSLGSHLAAMTCCSTG